MKHAADVTALYRALAECLEGVEKDVGAEWQPTMKLGSAEREINKVKRMERLEALLRLLAILARRGRVRPFIEALGKLEAKVSFAEVLAQIRRLPEQIDMLGGEVIELMRVLPEIERAVRAESNAEVLPLRRKPKG